MTPLEAPATEVRYRRIARRITLTLFAAQSLGSAGFLAAATVNAIVGAQLSGRASWAGLPTATYQFGMALAAFGWGHAMDRLGRRPTMALGLGCGVMGAALAASAVLLRSLDVLLAGLVLMGAANSALQLGRFVAAEVHPPVRRARAISNVVMGGTVGAIVGPLAVGPMGRWAQQAGFDELAGSYAASSLLFVAAVLVIHAFLRPEPREVGRELAALYLSPGVAGQEARPLADILRQPAARLAMVTMVSAQVIMMMLMVITSLHMKVHHHSLTSISLVISSHVVGMYAFSVFSGRLADRWGRRPVIAVGAAILLVSSLSAPLSPNVLPISLALFLLGLGWNFCYVGGSSLLADQLRPAERGRTQGFNDLMMGLVSATGSLSSGMIFAAVGYGAMGLVCAAAALVPLALILSLPRLRPPLPAAS